MDLIYAAKNYFLTDKTIFFFLTDYGHIAATVIITFMCEKLFFALLVKIPLNYYIRKNYLIIGCNRNDEKIWI